MHKGPEAADDESEVSTKELLLPMRQLDDAERQEIFFACTPFRIDLDEELTEFEEQYGPSSPLDGED
jgi:hypothetical protein